MLLLYLKFAKIQGFSLASYFFELSRTCSQNAILGFRSTSFHKETFRHLTENFPMLEHVCWVYIVLYMFFGVWVVRRAAIIPQRRGEHQSPGGVATVCRVKPIVTETQICGTSDQTSPRQLNCMFEQVRIACRLKGKSTCYRWLLYLHGQRNLCQLTHGLAKQKTGTEKRFSVSAFFVWGKFGVF